MEVSPTWKFERHVCRSSQSEDESNFNPYKKMNNYFSSSGCSVGEEVESSEDDASRVDFRHNIDEDEDVGVKLNSYDCDLNLIIDKDTGTHASPLKSKILQHLRGGVRATYGFSSGRICFEIKFNMCNLPRSEINENNYEFRVGWSSLRSSLQLGEGIHSYGFSSNGVVWSNGECKSYGSLICHGDVVGALLDLDSDPVIMSFTLNGTPVGIAFKVPACDLEAVPLFPHVLTKNASFDINFRSSFRWWQPPAGYCFAGDTVLDERVAGFLQPEENIREVILVCGLPRCGKSTWIEKFCEENSHKYYVLNCSSQLDPKQIGNDVDWSTLRKCEKLLKKIASKYNRKYIFEEDTLSHTTQKYMLALFKNFLRQAVIIVPSDREYDRRFKEAKHRKSLEHFYVEYMKAKFLLPAMGIFDVIVYPELPEDQARMSITRYNEDGDRYSRAGTKHHGKTVNNLISSLCNGGMYDVDFSSSDDSMSEVEDIMSSSQRKGNTCVSDNPVKDYDQPRTSSSSSADLLDEASPNACETNQETQEFICNLPNSLNNLKQFERYPVKNTQIAVYNFQDCKVGLTHEGLCSSHNHNRDGHMMNSALPTSVSAVSGRRGTGFFKSRFGRRKYNNVNKSLHHHDLRPQFRSSYRTANNYRGLNIYYQNRHRNWGQRANERQHRTGDDYDRKTVPSYGGNLEASSGYFTDSHYQTRNNGYGFTDGYTQGDNLNDRYYWSNV